MLWLPYLLHNLLPDYYILKNLLSKITHRFCWWYISYCCCFLWFAVLAGFNLKSCWWQLVSWTLHQLLILLLLLLLFLFHDACLLPTGWLLVMVLLLTIANPINKKETKLLQQVCGKFLCYARAVDTIMLCTCPKWLLSNTNNKRYRKYNGSTNTHSQSLCMQCTLGHCGAPCHTTNEDFNYYPPK